MDARVKPGHDGCVARLKGWAVLSFETHRWRDAPQDEAGRDCALLVGWVQRSETHPCRICSDGFHFVQPILRAVRRILEHREA
jgi:hypothetical protein